MAARETYIAWRDSGVAAAGLHAESISPPFFSIAATSSAQNLQRWLS